MALVATLLRYGVSVREMRTPAQWGDACDLVDMAMGDTGTELFAAVAGWDHPMSRVDMLLVVAQYGEKSHEVLPFGRASDVSDEEVSAAHDELLAEIKFS